MEDLFVRTTLIALLAVGLLSGCESTTSYIAPATFESKTPVAFVTLPADGSTVTALQLIDYRARASTSAVGFSDLGVTVTPVTLPGIKGSIAFAFSQLLQGSTIETPIYLLAGGQPVTIGGGDYANTKIITGFTPNNDIIRVYINNNSTPVDIADVSYLPSGYRLIGLGDAKSDYPPPAIKVTPRDNDNSFTSGDTVFIHLLASQVRGENGELIKGAVNANGEPILLTLPDNTTVPVAGSIVFVVP